MRDHSTTTTAPVPALGGERDLVRYLTQLYPLPGMPLALPADRFTVGRHADGLSVSDSRMSRVHFELRPGSEFDVVRLRDLGSKNGTLVNGVPAQQEYLRDGAVIRAGDSLFSFSERPTPLGGVSGVEPGRSLTLSCALALAERVAPSDLAVLLSGPKGAGKEFMASGIHAASGREGPFVKVDCAALASEQVGAELFGRAEGERGVFEQAKGGTLYLDAVDAVPMDQQANLLRALQEKRVRPLGAERERSVDVRVIAASTEDLDQRVGAGGLRGDLLARLAGVRIQVSSLATRRGDILPLFHRFLGFECDVEVDAAEMLLVYPWPYNVGELQHVAAKVKLFAEEGARVSKGMLPLELQRSLKSALPPSISGELDKAALEALLAEHQGNVARVARATGQSRQRIYRKLDAFNLKATRFR